MATPYCGICQQSFPGWKSLAEHILEKRNRKTHAKGKKWAAKFTMNTKCLDRKAQLQQMRQKRSPLTKQEKQNKEDSHRELSGNMKTVLAVCPKCKEKHQTSVPVEFYESPDAWRIPSGLIIFCGSCR